MKRDLYAKAKERIENERKIDEIEVLINLQDEKFIKLLRILQTKYD